MTEGVEGRRKKSQLVSKFIKEGGLEGRLEVFNDFHWEIRVWG